MDDVLDLSGEEWNKIDVNRSTWILDLLCETMYDRCRSCVCYWLSNSETEDGRTSNRLDALVRS